VCYISKGAECVGEHDTEVIPCSNEMQGRGEEARHKHYFSTGSRPTFGLAYTSIAC